MKFQLLTIIPLIFGVLSSYAQTPNESVNKNWSIETSPVYAIFRVYYINLGYKINFNSSLYTELLFGPCYQNWKNDNGQAHGYSLILGSRLVYNEHLNLESIFYPSYNPFRSSVDGELYRGVDGFAEFFIGYKINLFNNKLSINPQIGLGVALFRINPWPEAVQESPIVILPNLMISSNW